MAETDDDAVTSKADALALAEEADAEAAEAELLAAAARAKARAARLRREALNAADDDDEYEDDYDDDEYEDYDESEEYDEAEYEPEDYDESENYSESEPLTPSRRDRLRSSMRVPKLSTILKVAAVILILGFFVLSGLFAWWHHESSEKRQKEAEFIAGAKQGVVFMTSLDFNRAKQDVQRVIDNSTGEFRDDFQQRAAEFTKVVEQSKVVTEGTVNAAAIESMDGHSAQVLVSATSRVTNGTGNPDEPRPWRLRVTVTEEDGQYKMSKVEFVP